MLEDLRALEAQALGALANAHNPAELAEWKGAYLGKQGALTRMSKRLGTLPPEQRRDVGAKFNQVRQQLDQALDAAEAQLKRAARMDELEADLVDVTMPGRAPSVGRLHPSTIVIRNVIETFAEMGFQVWDSPEVETDEFNFGLLNFPPDHPARDMQDTFYIETPPGSPPVVLRTHTSPGQIHAMRRYAPAPLRVLLPGKCYRMEQVTARSEMMFHQFEFLMVGRNVTMGDLKGTLHGLAERLFGQGTQVRLRPSYFPFTEPSAELDVSCFLCGGKGCRICKYAGWLEIGGCGMVHPHVLRNGGYDPAEFSGFAGGFGPERIGILKYGIDDIRWFFSGDERFLQQFG
ncbi:MAG: phenylalanine--tRNA ligase subunit alpha [Kouleothrix sp.]|jgi:phenylalanyl-tRNA synthetase alpha chain|nr:phenylalanine--tRNA ligase subunit alpha [Kouleothrix sp.]